MATDRRAITSYLPDDLESKLIKYCSEYSITRKDKDGNVVPSMGTGIVEILKLFFSQDELPSPLPSKVSGGNIALAVLEANLKKYIDSKLPEYETSEIPSQITEYIDSQIASAVPKYINSKLPEYLSDKLPSDIPENITPRLDTLNRELAALSEEIASVKKPKPSYLIR